jgi:hypothetical protein
MMSRCWSLELVSDVPAPVTFRGFDVPMAVQPEISGEAIVEAAGGALTRKSSPHFDSVVVTLTPPEAVATSSTGRLSPWAETVSLFDSCGIELVGAMVHCSSNSLTPLVVLEETFVPLAFGSRAVTDDIVRSALRLEYWLVPAFQDSHFAPSFFACAAVRPKSVVRPDELPLTYAWAGVTLIAKSALPSKRVSEPLVVPTSAIIFSVVDDALERAINTT